MDFNQYQEAATRTANPHDNALANYGLGIAGEAGEVADLIKKYVFHGHDIDREDIKKELGDVLWYLSNIAETANISLEEIAIANIEKLKRRYPEGFNKEASVNRSE